MADRRRTVVERLKSLTMAPGFSVRSSLLVASALCLAFAIWSIATGSLAGLLGGIAGFVFLVALAVGAQYVAERSGAAARDHAHEEELRAEMAAWPRWKRISFLVLGALLGAGVILLRIWSESSRPN